jgi:hypothetical protein
MDANVETTKQTNAQNSNHGWPRHDGYLTEANEVNEDRPRFSVLVAFVIFCRKFFVFFALFAVIPAQITGSA